ncbi:uncharacterized protein I206_107873 [Kwoniella pini CBS 10737]|uniref:Cell division control protein 14 n=1 Tax=Kwoniella pini CBS 10737 TaxID=1296096 RepID=A0A1B9HYJ4_9TREE|nr:uncharacterized protein I206_06204 [Kwoniella pini CBS 10737]OCF48336.1 hypothetical protein I206_06204 [Kwoniella pini CBS 10737]
MLRPQGHRKSQSTSALSFLANQDRSSSSSNTSDQSSSRHNKAQDETKGTYRSRQSLLPSVRESESSAASMTILPRITASRRSSQISLVMDDDLTKKSSGQSQRSNRSKSHSAAEVSRREKSTTEAMKREKSIENGLESWLSDLKSLRSSARRRLSALKHLEKRLVEICLGQSQSEIGDLLSRQIHNILLSLLTRYTSTLSQRSSHTSLPAKDEVAYALIPEIETIASILQGLCCLSRTCKETMGEGWVMEMFIDLLLLLRSQPPLTDNSKAIAYTILELLFCVLVDSPKNARTYEKLGGLEAVVRVLKGTGVTKDVRMKCIEFLYFYLLPEQNDSQRVVSCASSSSSSSTESTLFPPSPLSTSQAFMEPPSISHTGRISPGHPRELADIDMPFVPMTPRKAPQPNLGYLTPATRKSSVCISNSSTPSLPTVPASPRMPISQSTTSRGLAAMLDEMDDSTCPTPRSSRSSRATSDDEKSGVGLGLGLPKISSGLVRSNTTQRYLSSMAAGKESTAFIDPFNLSSTSERSHSGSSGSSTVVPTTASRSISRSSTQPSLTITDSNGLPRSPSTTSTIGIPRRTSVRRVSKSPLIHSSLPESPEKQSPRSPKIRHSRTQSHLSGLNGMRKSSIPPVPPLPMSNEQTTRTPSNKSRAFPAELTRGIPPSASSPSLAGGMTPLGASKRVISDKKNLQSSTRKDRSIEEKKKLKDVKSVEEKKEMLGMWLGNVDQLVQGVEKVSFWGSIGNGARAGR